MYSEQYLDLLKKSLLGWSQIGTTRWIIRNKGFAGILNKVLSFCGITRYQICKSYAITFENKLKGSELYPDSMTMIGLMRLNNLEVCIRDVVKNGVPGDLIETGVWRGGATIFMRGLLSVLEVTDRNVWVADSFEGLPVPDTTNSREVPKDIDPDKYLVVSIEEVKRNFKNYNLLDNRVKFLKGWFKDTLPDAPIERLAVLRLDGDYYESTMTVLEHLYPKVSTGGYIIVDDYSISACRNAIEDYRQLHGITDPIQKIDWTGVYWKKS